MSRFGRGKRETGKSGVLSLQTGEWRAARGRENGGNLSRGQAAKADFLVAAGMCWKARRAQLCAGRGGRLDGCGIRPEFFARRLKWRRGGIFFLPRARIVLD